MPNSYENSVDSWLQSKGNSVAPDGNNPYDAVVADIQAQRQQQARAIYEKALAVNPDQAAENKKLSNTTGLSVEMIERNKEEIKRREQARILDLAQMAQDSPVLARQMLDPTFTKQTHDDIGTLGKIEKSLDRTFLGTVGDVAVTALKGAVGLPQSFVGLADLATGGYAGKGVQAVGIDFKRTQNILGEMYSPAQQAANKRVEEVDGFFNTLGEMVSNPSTIATTIGESLPQMLGGAAIARKLLTTGAKALGVGMAGPTLPGLMVRQFGEKYAPVIAAAIGEGTLGAGAAAENYRADDIKGLLTAKTTLASLGAGAGTALFSLAGGAAARRMGLEDIDTALASRGIDAGTASTLKTGFIASILKAGISESVFEEMPQSIQEKMWQNWGEDKPLTEGVGKAAAQGVLAGFSMGGGFQAISRVQERFNGTASAVNDAAHLQEQFSLAAGALLRERNPEEFRSLIQSMADQTEGAPTELYVDAEVLNQLAPEILSQLPGVAEQMEAALAANSVVSIPIGDVLTIAPGTPLEQMLVEHARIGDTAAMSQAEAREAGAKAQEYLAQESQRVIQQATDQAAMQASSDRVKQGVLDQLNTVGRFRKDVNEGYASWATAFYTTMAGRTGMTPEEMAAKYPLRIVGKTGQGSVLNGGEQTNTPEFKTFFGKSKATDSKGNALRVYHGTRRSFDAFSLQFREEGQGNDQYGPGYYTTTSSTGAGAYASAEGANIMPLYVSIQNPIQGNDSPPLSAKQVEALLRASPDFADRLENFGDVNFEGEAKVVKAAVDAFMFYEDALSQIQTIKNDFYSDPEAFLRVAKEVTGYDGVEVDNGAAGKFFVAWAPEQLKSATGNNGNFDVNDPNVLNQSASIRAGEETMREFGLDPGKQYTTRQIAQALEARQLAKYGNIARDDRSQEAIGKIADWIMAEVKFEMANPENSGVGWYSQKFQTALDTMGETFPELLTDQNARDVMTSLIAITSDGQKVMGNTNQAMDIYANFRESGSFTTDIGHQRQDSIDGNLEVLQNLFDELGAEGMRDFLMNEKTISELKKIAKENGTDLKSDYQTIIKMPMAVVALGPKLGAFYANLMGSHGYLTMDRWWSRTFNRYRGGLLTKPSSSGMRTFAALVGKPRMSDEQVLQAVLKPQAALEARGFKTQLAVMVGTSEPGKTADKVKWMEQARQLAGAKFDKLYKEHNIERAANTIYKMAFLNLEDAPFGAKDRTFMLDATNAAQKKLAAEGYNLTIADIQAILWYYEKKLYGELGARSSGKISYEEAARIVVDARNNGVDISELESADEDEDSDSAEGGVPLGEEIYNAGGQADGVLNQSSQDNGVLVDASGRPLAMYHGGLENYGSEANNVTRADRYRPFWITPERTLADSYGTARGGQVTELFANIKNPADLEALAAELLPIYNADQAMLDDNPDAEWTEGDGDIAQSAYLLTNSTDVMDYLVEQGYDSVTLEERPGVRSYGILDPNQVTLANDVLNQDAPTFYSALTRAVEGAKQSKAPAKDWLAIITKLPGVKAEEVEWTGLREYLELRGKDQVTRDEIAQYLGENGVRVEEVMKSTGTSKSGTGQITGPNVIGYYYVEHLDGTTAGPFFNEEEAQDELYAEPENTTGNTKYADYQLPGGENYRELLLTLPVTQTGELPPGYTLIDDAQSARADGLDIPADEVGPWRFDGPNISSRMYKTREEALAALLSDAKTEAETSGLANYRSSHWEEGNVLAHIRMNDRTDADGNKVLFIEELQSDWAQDGRKRGFKETDKEFQQRSKELQAREQELGNKFDAGTITKEENTELETIVAQRRKLQQNDNGVVTAPFVGETKSWLSLGIKRVIAYAAANGYDKVAFANGEQSADRYDLSKQIESIAATKKADGTYALLVSTKKGDDFNRTNVPASGLEEIVGKEMAAKIIEATEGDSKKANFSGLDLKVGGEGMKAFYDKIVPQTTNDVLKKLGGGKLETIRLNTGALDVAAGKRAQEYHGISEEFWNDLSYQEQNELIREANKEGTQQPGFTITPAMREKVAGGQALFQGARGTFNPSNMELALNENADLSTFLHETGHFFLEVMADLASQPGAPADIQSDMAELIKWFGVSDLATWNNMTLDQKRPYHERFAESFEQYLLEGKAPSLELQPLFRKFRAWMLNVYKSLKAFIDSRVPVTQGGDSLAQAAYHGTPHRGINKFSTDKIGTGEGAQAYGWGLYFASKREIAEWYRETLQQDSVEAALSRLNDGQEPKLNDENSTAGVFLRRFDGDGGRYTTPDGVAFDDVINELGGRISRKHEADGFDVYQFPDGSIIANGDGGWYPMSEPVPGQLYEVDIPEDSEMLLWDKPLNEQSDADLLRDIAEQEDLQLQYRKATLHGERTGEDFYQALSQKLGSDESASRVLESYGVKGIKYLDGNSRAAGDGSYNYVVFSGDNVEIQQSFYQDPNAAPGTNIQLSDEVRQVFDRMLASEEQIAQANEVAGLLPDQDADAEAIERLTARSLRDLKWTVNARAREIKKLQKQAAELRKGVEAEVRAEVEQQPVYAARNFLRTDTKLDISALEEAYTGEGDRYALLDWKPLVDQKLAGKEGAHPDLVADIFGFASGDEMVRALLSAEPIASVIQGITDQRMLEQHGDLIDQRAIEAAANEAVHNEARARSLATELKSQGEALNARTDTGQVNAKGSKVTVNAIVEAAKQFAANVISRTPLRDLKSKAAQHTAAERRAGKRWQEHTSKGETAEAIKAKQDQVLNNAAAKAAIEAQEEMRKILTFFKRVIKDNNEKTVAKGRDPDVVNAARAILGAYGIAPKGAKTAAEYMDLVAKNDPAMFAALQASVQGALNMAQPLDALTMDELRGLHEEIQAMWHLAKRSRQMEVDGNLMDMQDAEDELQGRMQEIGVPDSMPGETSAVTSKEAAGRALQFARSLLQRVEQWSEGMGAPFTKLVFQPVKDAANRYRADRVKYRKAYQALVDRVAPHLRKGPIEAPELNYTFGKGHNGIGHAELLHAILHTGNESNKRKLLLGRKWATENADGTLDTTNWDNFIQRMWSTGVLTGDHYAFAQGVWDLLEQTKPLAQKTHRDVFGRYFAEVTADEFTTPFGTYAGGYVPAQADPRIVQDAALRDLAASENENMAFSFPGTNKGFTKGRVEYNRPLMLDLRTIGQHIDKVLLFSHMEPAVRDVNKLLSRKGVSYSLGRIDPTIYAGMLTPWLNRSARQVVETPIVGDGGVSRVLSAARGRAGMALMFANISNSLQQLTGFSTAFAKLKADGLNSHMLRATAAFIASPKQMAAAVSDASPFMASRMENEISAINDAMDAILLDPNLYQKAQAWTQKHAYFMQSAMANTMEPIIWHAGYNGALEKGQSTEQAVRYADALIRQTQGSTLPEDVSRIETGPAYARMFTQFIGYFNMIANTNGTALKRIAEEEGLKKGAGKALMVVTMGMLVPIWVAEAIAIAMRGGPDDEDDDGYLDDWLAAVFGMGTIKGMFAMVPFVGQAANASINRFNGNPADDKMSLSPAVSLLEGAVGVPVDVYKLMTDPDKLNKRTAVRDVASAISILTGLPAVAVARPLGYLAGMSDDKIDPTSGVDMARGLLTGTPSPGSK